MHHCLHISEIVVSVVGYLRKYDTDLLHLALACQVFYEPAMDVLWACTPYALEKLLLCLPPDAVYTTQLHLRIEGKPKSYQPVIVSVCLQWVRPSRLTRANSVVG